jgi:manganese/zinc/iron transport system permease protein
MFTDWLNTLQTWSAGDTKIAAAAAVAAMSCALPGVWLVLRRHSMMGDALSHTALPGVVIAFLIAHALESRGWISATASPAAMHIVLFLGAIVIGLVTSLITELVQKLGRVESGAALGVVFTWMFALGLFLMVLLANTVHIDPDCVLFGQLELVPLDSGVPRAIVVNGTALAVNLGLMALFFKELRLSAFDPALADSLGISSKWMHYALMAATAVTVVAAFETVGSILVVGLLIAPAATAFLLTDRLLPLIAVSLIVAALSGVLGHVFARTLPPVVFPRIGFPEVEDVLTSGMVPVAAALLFVLAWLFSPRHGLVGTWLSQARLTVRIAGDDLLGLLYRIEERGLEQTAPLAPALVAQRLGLGRWLTRLTVWDLCRRRLVTPEGKRFHLTDAGRAQAVTLVRAHRLWESYLQKHFALPEDHLHAAAHRAEHYIDRTLGAELAAELESPGRDPHGSVIPEDWQLPANSPTDTASSHST